MATNFYPIGSGETYTTIAGWEAAMSALGSDIEVGVLVDNSEYLLTSETIFAVGGTASTTAYLRLTANDGSIDDSSNGDVRHNGTSGSGARIRSTAGSTAGCLQLNENFTVLDHLDIEESTTTTGVRLITTDNNNGNRHWIDCCIIRHDYDSTSNQEGFDCQTNNSDTITITNCIFIGFEEHAVFTRARSTSDPTLEIYYCAFLSNDDNVGQSGTIFASIDTGNTVSLVCYNNWCESSTADRECVDHAGAGTVTLTGSNNAIAAATAAFAIVDTDNSTGEINATSGVTTTTQASGSYLVVVNDSAVGSDDLNLLDEAGGNLLANGGTASIGTPTETRWVSGTSPSDGLGAQGIDMVGNTRHASTPDIGPLEFQSVAAGGIVTRRRSATRRHLLTR